MNNELKPYDEYKISKQEWLGCIPTHWKQAKSKRLFKEISIKNCQDEELLSATQNRGVIPRSMLKTRVVMPTGNLETFKLVREGNFVISLRSFQGGLEYSKYRGIVSPAYNILEQKSKQKGMYYKYLFKSHNFIGELQRNVTGIRQGKNIDVNDFKEIVLPIPTLEEQDLIVKYLDHQLAKINKFIKAKKKLIAALKEQNQAVINEVVTKGINPNVMMKPSGVEWLGNIPEDWKVEKFSRIAKVKSNLVHPSDYLSFIQVSPENIEKNTGKLFECKTVLESGIISDNHLFYKGQILYSKVRPKLNKVTIAPFNGLCSADMYPIETTLETKYLLYYMLSDLFLLQLAVTDNRVKMPKINKEELSCIIVVIPPRNVQKDIVDYIEKRKMITDKLVSDLEKEIELVNEYKISLISDVVTGNVDVRNIKINEVLNEEIEFEVADDETIEGEEDIEIEESGE